MRPRLLRSDNVTPPTRTPWGGRVIAGRIKRGLELGLDELVGESWEVAVEPSFPSRFADDGCELGQAIATDPAAWLGPDMAARHHGRLPLLVKLLDAGQPLSVQVHPALDDAALAADQSGKPEGWYILASAPGAGLYLGFREGVDRARVQACVHGRASLAELMNFVPVRPGDAFQVHAGVAHAIGAGVTLLEPQFVSPGKRGVTYRYWDWDRRYDEHGQVSEHGVARELHLERALAVTDWDAPRGLAAVEQCRVRPEALAPVEGTLGRTRVLAWPYFALERWAGRGVLELQPAGTLLAVVCVAGAAELSSAAGSIVISRGQSAVVPAAAGQLRVETRAHPLDGPVDVDLLVTGSHAWRSRPGQ
jgi:mannose-6-phosphate isomerase